jgi:hypothetical protein
MSRHNAPTAAVNGHAGPAALRFTKPDRRGSARRREARRLKDAIAAMGDEVLLAAANGKGKVRLLSRQALDGRSRAYRDFDAIVRRLANDIGGDDQSRISTIQWILIEAAASLKVCHNDQNARMLLGQHFDPLQLCQTITTLVRVASRLPHGRVAKDITPTTLGAILRQGIERERDHAD